MNPDLHPDRKPSGRRFDVLWLLVGLAPIPLTLLAGGNARNNSHFAWLLWITALCCLCGGIGCLRSVKNIALRLVLGVLLGALLFIVTLIVAIFQACSRSNF